MGVTFNRENYLQMSETFETKQIHEADEEMSEFNGDAEDLAFELAYTRYELAKMERNLNTIRELCGYVENGTDTSVMICQDDATKDLVLTVGNKKQELVFSPSFAGLFNIASKFLARGE